jgi:ribosomal-protein-alanine N-acetyltransferase
MNYEITTQRLVLQPLAYEHVPAMFKILNGYPEMMKFLSFDPPIDISESYASFSRSQKKFPDKAINWSIFLKNKYIGRITLMDLTSKDAELGFWLSPAFHSKGYMTEAVISVVQFAFEKISLSKVRVGHFADNIASKRVIEKADFQFVSVKNQLDARDGTFSDHVWYEILKNK